jgi:hypothetical protein
VVDDLLGADYGLWLWLGLLVDDGWRLGLRVWELGLWRGLGLGLVEGYGVKNALDLRLGGQVFDLLG